MAVAPAHEDVFAACLEAAVALGTAFAPTLVTRAGELMVTRAGRAASPQERQALLEAERLLAPRAALFAAAYPMALRAEFAAAQAEAAAPAQALSFDGLELMQEDQVDETVEVVRGQQLVLAEVEAEMGTLNALVSAARGLHVVSAAANPLRPDAWVRALRDAARECRVPAAVRVRWLTALCEALGPQLAGGYRSLCDLLRRQGITAASFVVSPAGAGALAGGANPSGGARPQAASAPSSTPLLNLRDLRRLLAGDGAPAGATQPLGAAPPSDAGPTQDQGLTVPWAFDALQQMKGVDLVMQRMQQRLSGDERSGGAPALTAAQALGQEVVRVMVENISGDERLAAAVRQAILDLEPALLRLVRADPRFFRDKDHPTRRFLSEVTERGLAWPSPDQPRFAAFFAPVREAVDALSSVLTDSAEPFEVALQLVMQAWAQEEARSRQQRARAAQVLLHAEERNLIALGVADEMRRRPDVAAAPAEMRRFMTGPWSQVIAAARMKASDGADAHAYADAVNDLIWSTQPRLAAANRARLARLVPPLLGTLRRGLASIEYPAPQTQRLLEVLGDLHQLALRPPPSGPAPIPQEESGRPLDQRESELWLEPREARESGLMEWEPLATPPARRDAGPRSGTDDRTPGLDRFHTGVWVDLLLDGVWSRWRLAWSGTHALLFLFTDGASGSRSMTRGTLEKMIAQGGVRLVAEQPVLAGALDAVATRALRNSIDTTL